MGYIRTIRYIHVGKILASGRANRLRLTVHPFGRSKFCFTRTLIYYSIYANINIIRAYIIDRVVSIPGVDNFADIFIYTANYGNLYSYLGTTTALIKTQVSVRATKIYYSFIIRAILRVRSYSDYLSWTRAKYYFFFCFLSIRNERENVFFFFFKSRTR